MQEKIVPGWRLPFLRMPGPAAASTMEALAIPVGAVIVSMLLFGVFMIFVGQNPFEIYQSIYKGAFGSWFSWQNTLQRASPIMLVALCTALPARLGLIVIGGEGALVIGAVATVTAAVAVEGAPPGLITTIMLSAGALAGGLWIAFVGALRHYRGVNETISSLLLNYIAIAVMSQVYRPLNLNQAPYGTPRCCTSRRAGTWEKPICSAPSPAWMSTGAWSSG